MTYQAVIDWINFHKVELIIGALLLISLVYSRIKKKKLEKANKELAESTTREESPKVEGDVEFTQLDIDQAFMDVNVLGSNNLENIKNLKNTIREEIDTLKEKWIERKKDFENLIKWGKKMAIHIKILEQQEIMYKGQISTLESQDEQTETEPTQPSGQVHGQESYKP